MLHRAALPGLVDRMKRLRPCVLRLPGLMLVSAPAVAETRTGTFSYELTSRELVKEVIDPTDPALCLVT